MSLRTNMRVHLTGDQSSAQFAQQLLNVGNGTLNASDDHSVTLEFGMQIPDEDQLIHKVFPNLQLRYTDPYWLCERAILAPLNATVDDINSKLLHILPGQPMVYKSVDFVTDSDETVNYPTEFLNSLTIAGLPPHKLTLKVGAPIILLRNLNPPKLCNGTRLTIKQLTNNLIEATIMTGMAKGEAVFIPKIPLIPSNTPFPFKRIQFPVKISFAITINKSQGQSLKVVGLNLLEPVFSHGQLYVGCTRVGSQDNLFILSPGGKTKNIVYNEALN